MTNANDIFDTQAERIADMFKVSDHLLSKSEKIAYLHDVASETSASPFTASVLLSKVRVLVGEEIYLSLYPEQIYN